MYRILAFFLLITSFLAHSETLEVSINVLEGAGWKEKEIESLINHTARSYGNCGIRVNFTIEEVIDRNNTYQKLSDFFSTKTHLEITELIKAESKLNVYLTQSQDGFFGPVEGRAIRSSNIYEEIFQPLSNTVWISREPLLALSEKYKNDLLEHVLSHEIAHILGLEHSYRSKDIMNNGRRDFGKSIPKNFRRKQCQILLNGLVNLKI
jgi:predicted Zn-dependent protease with MMP-like domain